MLDWPLMEYLDCVWVDQDYRDPGGGNSKSQPVTHADGHSTRLYGSGGLKPVLDSNQRGWGQGMSPMFHFRGVEVRDALEGLKGEKGDPFEGIKMQFVNPVSGKPIYPTLDYSAQLLRPGEELQFKRETASTYALVLAGKGFSEIGGERYDWEENDVMAIPNFLWRRHVNNGSEDAIIYTTSDKSLLENIGQYRSQGKAKDGGMVQIVQ
jgi:gentisate 1,2-dioxygenase